MNTLGYLLQPTDKHRLMVAKISAQDLSYLTGIKGGRGLGWRERQEGDVDSVPWANIYLRLVLSVFVGYDEARAIVGEAIEPG